jgi:hypothetical protein
VKILIDDERDELPDGSKPDIIARNWLAGMLVLTTVRYLESMPLIDLYLDHDLGEENEQANGHDIISNIEMDHAINGTPLPRSIRCVSDNGQGAGRIRQAIDKLYKER